MRGLTLRQLAERSGVASSTLSLVERGGRSGENLTVETIRKLAKALAVTTDYLCGMYEGDQGEGLWPPGLVDDVAFSRPEVAVSAT
jgi:transcriptional regulator with XRE-family HTH domain